MGGNQIYARLRIIPLNFLELGIQQYINSRLLLNNAEYYTIFSSLYLCSFSVELFLKSYHLFLYIDLLEKNNSDLLENINKQLLEEELFKKVKIFSHKLSKMGNTLDQNELLTFLEKIYYNFRYPEKSDIPGTRKSLKINNTYDDLILNFDSNNNNHIFTLSDYDKLIMNIFKNIVEIVEKNYIFNSSVFIFLYSKKNIDNILLKNKYKDFWGGLILEYNRKK